MLTLCHRNPGSSHPLSLPLTQRRVDLLQAMNREVERLEERREAPGTRGVIKVTLPTPSSSFAGGLGLLSPGEQHRWEITEAERRERVERDREVAELWVAAMVEEGREGEMFFSQEELEAIGREDFGKKGKGVARE